VTEIMLKTLVKYLNRLLLGEVFQLPNN